MKVLRDLLSAVQSKAFYIIAPFLGSRRNVVEPPHSGPLGFGHSSYIVAASSQWYEANQVFVVPSRETTALTSPYLPLTPLQGLLPSRPP